MRTSTPCFCASRMRLRVFEWNVDERGAQRHDALLGDGQAVALEQGDVLGRARPLRLEAEQESAGGLRHLDRGGDERVDDLDVLGIGGGAARHEAEAAVRPGLEHQHLQRADDLIAAACHDPRRRRLQVGLQLAPFPGLEEVAVRARLDEGVPRPARVGRGERDRLAHERTGAASDLVTPRVSPQKSP
jgi:hypothetical protein